MKKLVTIIILCIFTLGLPTICNAQSFGIKAGLNIANMFAEDYNGPFDTKSVNGLNIGVVVDLMNNGPFNIETGLNYSNKGMKYIPGDQWNSQYRFKTSNLDLPLCAKYEFEVADDTKVFGKGGGYLGYGLKGTYTDTGESYNIHWDEVSEDGANLKRVDYGVILGVGVKYQSIQLSIDYQIGLRNITTAEESTVNNRVLGISLAYYFGKKK